MGEDLQLVDVATLAEALNLTERRIAQLVIEGMPKHARGQYPMDACMRWYVRYLQNCLERKAILTPDGMHGTASVRLRRETAEAAIKEIELAKLQGDLVAISDVEKSMTDLVLAAKARILAVPARVAGEIVTLRSRTEVQQCMDRGLRDALKQLEMATA